MLRHRVACAGLVWLCLVSLLATVTAVSVAGPAESTSWQVVGQIGGPTQGVAMQDNYAYVGIGLRLVVVDVTNPAAPTAAGTTAPFPYFVEGVAVSGSRAYVAAGAAGLRVVDISDPALPTEIGAWDSPGYAEGVAVSGSYAYLADGPYGLRAVDVSNPANPVPLGAAYDMNYANDVAAAGSHAYIAAAGAGLLIADLSDPGRPVEAGGLDTLGYAYGVAVSGTVAYVADGWEGLLIASVADPAQPVPLAALQTPGQPFGLALDSSRAYVADAYAGLTVVDVSDPAQPLVLGGSPTSGGHAGSVAAAGGIACVADRTLGLRVIDVANPADPVQVGSHREPFAARDVEVRGDVAYLTAGLSGFHTLDVSDPARPRLLATYDTQAWATFFTLDGDYAYAGTIIPGPGYGLHVLDISDPAQPALAGRFTDHMAETWGIDVEDGIAYIEDGWMLLILDVSDPHAPSFLSHSSTPGGGAGLAAREALLYIADGYEGLAVVDATDPAQPILLGSFQGDLDLAHDVAISGDMAYLADHFGMRIMEVTDPAHPQGRGFYDSPGLAQGIAVSGTLAYLADGGAGVQVVDAADPDNPLWAGGYDTAGYSHQVALAGDLLYVADDVGGLVVLQRTAGHVQEPSPAAQDTLGSPGYWPAVQRTLRRDAAAHAQPVDLPRWPQPAEPLRPVAPGSIESQRDAGRPAATCTVTTPADDGDGTLRRCLENAVAGDTVTFDPAVFPPASPATITVASDLPWLTQGGVTIDASNAGVVLDGSSAPAGTRGVVITSGGNRVQGLQIVGFPGDGVHINPGQYNLIGGDRGVGSGPLGQGNRISGNGGTGVMILGGTTLSNTVTGNLIGVDLSGTQMQGNGAGVVIGWGASYNRVGGSTPGERNIIGGSTGTYNAEVTVTEEGTRWNTIAGNYIGTDATGEAALRTSPPVEFWIAGVALGGQDNTLGPINVINGCTYGVVLNGADVRRNRVTGNRIGTNDGGTAAIGNFLHGVDIGGGATENRIGGDTPEERNLISGNGGSGVGLAGADTNDNVVIGNYIGVDHSGSLALGNAGDGVWIGATHNRVGGLEPGQRNVVSGNGAGGFNFIGGDASQNLVAGNYVGTDVSGTVDLGNVRCGSAIQMGANRNRIEGNLISGNGFGGVIFGDWGSDYNVLAGNRIGTDAAGAQAIPNDWLGVYLAWGSFNRIGGTQAGEGNLISGNPAGLALETMMAADRLVLGNLIGTDASGMLPLGNAGYGVGIVAGARAIVGGATPAERNVVSANGDSGIWITADGSVVAGNYVGVGADGDTPLGNSSQGVYIGGARNVVQGNQIAFSSLQGPGVRVDLYPANTLRRNAVWANGGQGILLSNGGNDILPAPVILTVTGYSIAGTACPGCTVEIFSDDEDEGRVYEGTTIADAAGIFGFGKGSPLAGPYLTTTATDSQGNTSEFSAPVARLGKVYLPLVVKNQASSIGR